MTDAPRNDSRFLSSHPRRALGVLGALLLAGLLVGALIPHRTWAQASSGEPIIDMHLHANKIGDLPAEEPVTGLKSPGSTEELRRQTLSALREHNVVLAATSADPVTDSYKQAAPDRIMKGCSVPPGPSGQQLDSLRMRIKSGNCAFIGELGYQYRGIPPNDPKVEPVFAIAESLDVPVGIHMGLGPPGVAYWEGLEKYRMKLSNPLLLEDVLVEHPDLRLYVMHAGWPMLDEMIGLLYAHPQVYVDVAVINWALPQAEFYRYLRRLVEAGFGNRIMHGSDQMNWPQSIGKSIEAIRSAPFLSEEEKRDILYNNAARFLNVSGTERARHREMAEK